MKKLLLLGALIITAFQVNAQCTASYSLTSNDPTFTFLNTTAGNVDAEYWDFGDGNTGVGSPVTHQYTTNGTYMVCLTSVDSVGGVSCTYCDSVLVTNAGAASGNCSAAFAYNMTPMGSVSFTSATSGVAPYTYFWSFGDGSSATSANPVHQYGNGSYAVCLTVTDAAGCTSTFCDSVSVGFLTSCSAYFYAFDDSTQANTILIYNVASGSAPLTYMWDFGDGNTSTQAYPSHTYAQLGSYQVCLTIADGSGCTSTYCDSVSVTVRSNGFTINILQPGTSGLDEEIAASFSAYPNPAHDALTLEWSPMIGNMDVSIHEVSGRLVKSFGQVDASTGKAEFNLNELPEGYYFLQLEMDGRSHVVPVVKK